MQLTAEEAKALAMRIAGALDQLTEHENATAILESRHGQEPAFLAVVITANPALIPELLKWTRESETLGALAMSDHRPGYPWTGNEP